MFEDLGEKFLEQGQSGIKKVSDTAVKQATATVKTTTSQILGTLADTPSETQPGTHANTQNPTADASSDPTKEFLKDLYGPSSAQNKNPQATPQTLPNGQLPQTAEDQKKIAEARKRLIELHTATYYNPTFNPPKRQEEPTADKLDREEQEEKAKEFDEFQKKKKKDDAPMSVRMGAQRAEKFPGASG